jgi:hypothetical protein
MTGTIKSKINKMPSISLSEMDAVALMKRTDTKFVIPLSKLDGLLDRISNQYCVLEVNNKRITTYSSQYFDTPEKRFYHDHHNGKINRLKVRIRKYVDSNIAFLEIKQKDGKGITTKSRTSIPDFETVLSSKSNRFIESITSQSLQLEPSLYNDFKRITLVSNNLNERATIDLNLSFALKESVKTFEKAVIIEVKQEGVNRNSPIIQALRNSREYPFSISKYCIGVLHHFQGIKYNRFKKKLITLKKISA